MFVAGSVLKGASVSRQMCNNTQRNPKKKKGLAFLLVHFTAEVMLTCSLNHQTFLVCILAKTDASSKTTLSKTGECSSMIYLQS